MKESIGMKVERWMCYGMPTEPLDSQTRSEVIAYALTFEECCETLEWLQACPDHDIIRTAYAAMAEYARGQM